MFGLSMSEIIIIALVGFIVIGPQNLPTFMRKVAGFYRQIFGLKEEFSAMVMNADYEESPKTEPKKLKETTKESAKYE